RGGTGEMEDAVDLEHQPLGDVVPDELEARLLEQVRDVAPRPRGEVVEADHLVPLDQEAFTQVGTQKPRPARHHDALHVEPRSNIRSHGRRATGPSSRIRASVPAPARPQTTSEAAPKR